MSVFEDVMGMLSICSKPAETKGNEGQVMKLAIGGMLVAVITILYSYVIYRKEVRS